MDHEETKGPGGGAIMFSWLTGFGAGVGLSEHFAVAATCIAANYVVAKISDSDWHAKYPDYNPKGEAFNGLMICHGIGGTIGLVFT